MTINSKSLCPVCGHIESKVIFEKDISYVHVGKSTFKVPFLKCKKCSFVFVNDGFVEFNKMWYEEIYKDIKEVNSVNEKRYLSWLDIIEPFRRTNKLFESGFGSGGFLKTACSKRGWECSGNEISTKACEKLSSCKIFNCDIAMINGSNEYDAVVSLGTIEHVTDPISQIKHYRRLLRNGGICFLSTPNINSLNRFVAGKEHRLFHPEHISYFSAKAIKKAFNISGFSDIKIWTQNIDIYDAINNITKRKGTSSIEVFNKNQDLRKKIDENSRLKNLKNIINKFVTFLNVGLEMYVIAIKK